MFDNVSQYEKLFVAGFICCGACIKRSSQFEVSVIRAKFRERDYIDYSINGL